MAALVPVRLAALRSVVAYTRVAAFDSSSLVERARQSHRFEGASMLSLAQAAKATGKAKATIARAIKAGRLSATRNEAGSHTIDPAELDRVFPFITGDPISGSW